MKRLFKETTIKTKPLESGESIEEKMRRVTTTNEPIDNVAPMIYTERKDGVLPECDIRTDRFEIAQDAMGVVAKTEAAKRENVDTTDTTDKTDKTDTTKTK